MPAKKDIRALAKLTANVVYRSDRINREKDVNETDRTVTLSFASETPVSRWGDVEILDCAASSVMLDRLNNGGSFLVNHDTGDQVGVVVKAWVESKRLYAKVKLSRSARGEEIFQDILDGIRTLVSVGYRVHEAVLESIVEGVETFRVMLWEPLELSTVPVPADATVGVGRSDETTSTIQPGPNNNNTTMKKRLLDPNALEGGNGTAVVQTPPAPAPAVRGEVVNEADVLRRERTRTTEIRALGVKAKTPAEVIERAVNEGWTPDRMRTEIFENHFPAAKPVATNSPDIGMDDKEKKRYSLVRAMSRLANGKALDGLEKEASDEVGKRTGREAQGFFVPTDVQSVKLRDVNPERSRALNAETATAGGYFVQETVLGDNMIELLRNKMYISSLGVTNLTGLVGDIAIPRQSGGATTYWLGEQDDTPESDQVIGQLTLRPRRLAALTAYTKQLLQQSSVSVELFVRNDLMKQLALAKDLAAIAGLGSGGQPLGIMNTTGVGSATFGGTATWPKVVSFETLVAQANADRGSMAFLTTPGVRGAWKTILKATGALVNGSSFIWDGGQVNGYPAEATNQVPGDKVIFGNFNDLVIADWDGLDIVVDPFTQAGKGNVRIVVMLMTDVGIRHPVSFVVSSDAGNQ